MMTECSACKGAGVTVARRVLEAVTGRLMWSQEPKGEGREQYTELTTGLAGRPPAYGIGHDEIDRFAAVEKIVAAAGLPKNWGECPACNGKCEVEMVETTGEES